MALNINTIKQASPKANQVATEQYVDTSIASIDVSSNINTNNDAFAQKLGYLNYADMIAAAERGKTIIIGGYLRGELIGANSITANQINTSGLIADNIKATSSIQGNSIYGSYIEGATVKGAVISASYLDLDGELTVMTDWSSTTKLGYSFPVDYNGTILYKLNTISSINDSDGVSCSALPGSSIYYMDVYGTTMQYYGANTTFKNDGGLYSYDSYSYSGSLRARKVRPTISFPSTEVIVSGGYRVGVGSKTVNVYLFGKYFGQAVLNNTYGSTSASFAGYSGNVTFSLNGITFKLAHDSYEIPNPSGWPTRVSYATLSIVAGTYSIPFDWNNQTELCKYIALTETTSGGSFPPFSINNL